MKESNGSGLGCLVMAVLIFAVFALLLGVLATGFGEGFAKGGGELNLEPRVLSPNTSSSATVYGDGGVAIAVQGSEDTNIDLAYNQVQPTAVPQSRQTNQASDDGLMGAVLPMLAVLGVLFAIVYFTFGSIPAGYE